MVFKTIGYYTPNEVSPRFDAISKEGTQFVGFRNLEQISDHTLQQNLDFLTKLKKDYPIIASIMGETEDKWTKLAELVTKTGCDIIECNFSCPQMTVEGMGCDVGQNPELVKKYTQATRKGTNLPILAKMTPNLSKIEPPAISSIEGGATGLAGINTIKSITSIALDDMIENPSIYGKTSISGYSGKAVKPIALRFICDMASNDKLKDIPISGMGGIKTWKDALEFIALGCSNIQITTSVMQYGYRIIDDLISGFKSYMIEHNISKLQDLVGIALNSIVSPDELNRDTMVYPKFDRDTCSGCGRCYISCADAGHQALTFDFNIRKPILNSSKCVGCLLCSLVCPVKAISSSKIISKNNI